jgi:Copper type II ascorbate-dependent monooxygenase, C-terminal domain
MFGTVSALMCLNCGPNSAQVPTASTPARAGSAGTPAVSPLAAAGTSAPSLGAAGASPGLPVASGEAETTGAAGTLPCEVGKVVANNCWSCHGSTPVGGAPMSLVTAADFAAVRTSKTTSPGAMFEIAKLVKMRINDAAKPMPPGGQLSAADLGVLNDWLDRDHPEGTASDLACAQPSVPDTSTTTPAVAAPSGTTCYQLRNHGQSTPGDTTPYSIVPGEQYVEFFYTAPWKVASELVSWRTIYDNRKVLHHWLLYTTVGSSMDGTIAPSIGTHIGDNAELLAGWAVGGSDVNMPDGVGLRLPAPGEGLMAEFHFYNTGDATEMDASAVEVCVVPADTLAPTAGMTWLGTENFNGPAGMPPKVQSEFSGTCTPSRTGMNDSDPIHVFTFWPHMHTYGRHMNSLVNRANGTQEQVFDKPFDFNYQVVYPAAVDLYPGDTITSTCTFLNTSNASVAFGPSTTQEMCYQFAFSYPAGALDNGVLSLVGATNTCW